MLGLLYGIATFYGLKNLEKPLRSAAVSVTSGTFTLVDRSREAFFNLKEGFEDIIAEAQYENLKRNQKTNAADWNSEEVNWKNDTNITANWKHTPTWSDEVEESF